jgi:hypothetical protein
MEDLPDGIDRIVARLERLERRVYVLEHPAEADSAAAEVAPSLSVAATSEEKLTASATVGTFPVLGKAMLGIAGAYLLRALTESNVMPSGLVAAVAIVYALAWLALASRAKNSNWISGLVYAGTSALILAPMLWELTLRFRVLSAPVAAVVVAGFAAAASALTWKQEQVSVVWVANLTAAGIALALSIATYRMIPFIGVLLVMVLITEYKAVRGIENGVRVVVSLAADAAIWALIFIYSSAESTRTNYPQLNAATLIAPGIMLFLIVGASVVYRTLSVGKRITVFEMIETAASFLLALCGVVYFGPHAIVIGFGVACLAMACAGYAISLYSFNSAEERRNLLVFAGWSCALLLAGSVLGLPNRAQPPWFGTWAVAASWIGMRMTRLHLEFHGLIFLLAAAAGSGLLNWVASELAGSLASSVALTAFLIMFCAVICYALAVRSGDEGWRQHAVAGAFAVITAGTVAALFVHGVMSLIALRIAPGAHHVAFIRTLTICAVAVGLAFGGARWGRVELTKIGYATLALLVLKLALEDLRHGQLAFIAGSIFLFAITLMAVPRVARMGQKINNVGPVKHVGIPSLPR